MVFPPDDDQVGVARERGEHGQEGVGGGESHCPPTYRCVGGGRRNSVVVQRGRQVRLPRVEKPDRTPASGVPTTRQ
jgi:hypothetical protein